MSSPNEQRPAAGNFRWVICALLFFSTTVNYMDRQVISYLKDYFCTPADQGGFGWTNTEYLKMKEVMAEPGNGTGSY